MKRKSFLVLSGIGLVAISGGVFFGVRSMKNRLGPISSPESLMTFCDENTIRSMGKEYLINHPEETGEKTLISLLGVSPYANHTKLSAYLQSQISRDFERNRTLVLQGWIISITEARQCALFSLLHPN